ncbi:hypothetical protein Dsin_033148 [Dipteronia sinensis]|uniref:Uncharacterized protein n=1 Tax=Dipteronia sinensis TaxID=43782 RepID=A0AAD9ZCT0_9ROSI|nr:hypothetical protein Dsin_033027 [Dipteronia sinensis]KAK3175662.1 hypothetical protein Dsin_033148 [Dipteronia sinensis]
MFEFLDRKKAGNLLLNSINLWINYTESSLNLNVQICVSFVVELVGILILINLIFLETKWRFSLFLECRLSICRLLKTNLSLSLSLETRQFVSLFIVINTSVIFFLVYVLVLACMYARVMKLLVCIFYFLLTLFFLLSFSFDVFIFVSNQEELKLFRFSQVCPRAISSLRKLEKFVINVMRQ